MAPAHARGGAGTRTSAAPAAATLDLTGLPLPGGTHGRPRACRSAPGRRRSGAAQDVTLRIHVQVGLGDVSLPGEKARTDVDVKPGQDRKVTLRPGGGRKSAAGTVELTWKSASDR